MDYTVSFIKFDESLPVWFLLHFLQHSLDICVPVCLYLPISCELFSIILAFSLITLFP